MSTKFTTTKVVSLQWTICKTSKIMLIFSQWPKRTVNDSKSISKKPSQAAVGD